MERAQSAFLDEPLHMLDEHVERQPAVIMAYMEAIVVIRFATAEIALAPPWSELRWYPLLFLSCRHLLHLGVRLRELRF